MWEDYWQGDEDLAWWKSPAQEVKAFIATESAAMRPSVLDLGCGLGRHAIAFARAGFTVTAIDASENAISYLTKWANKLSLDIQCEVGDDLLTEAQEDRFDIVLAYNVIYHGYRRDFAAAIDRVLQVLRANGVFYFTCPSRDDGKYGHGQEVAPHTFLCERSVTPGDIHYFADQADLDELLSGYLSFEATKLEGYWDNRGEHQFYSNWHVVARKR